MLHKKHFIFFLLLLLKTISFSQVSIIVDTTICNGDQIFLQGAFQNTTGTYIDSISCNPTCDTIITTNLSVASTNPIFNTVIQCAPYTHVLPDGTLVSTSGVYSVPLVSSAGCQFDYVTTLILNQPSNDTIYATICDNESYLLPNGLSVNTPGQHSATTLTPDGCIHYHTVFLTVLPSYTITIDTNVCAGTLYFLPNGFPAFNSDSYTNTFTSINGCDSTIITNLTYHSPQTISVVDSICASSSYTLPDNSIVNTSGVYSIPYSSIYGCDSTIEVTLTVLPEFNDTITTSICNGTPYVFPDGTSTLSSGYFPFNFTSQSGCDSLVVFDVVYSSTLYDTISATICNGQNYTMPDNSLVSSAGFHTVIINSVNGCDSSVTVNLSIDIPQTTIIDTIVCSGNTYILPNGFPAFWSGNYSHTLQNAWGCDSTIITNLTYQPAQSSSYSFEICEGDVHTMSDGSQFSTSGNHSIVLSSIYGCDSTVTVNLTVHPIYNDTLNAGICNGNPYTLPDGSSTTSPGIYSYSYTSVSGCDSNYTVALSLDLTQVDTVFSSICDGQTYNLPSGNSVMSGGTYLDTLLSASGCDSVIITNLSILSVDTTVIDTVMCSGSIYFRPNGFPAFFGGNYTDVLTNQQGCDSVVISNLTYQAPQTTNINTTICSNENYLMPDGSTVNTAGIHSVTVSSIYGCDSTITVNLFVYPAYNDTLDVIICDNEWYYLSATDSVNQPGVYLDTLTSINGCDSIQTLILDVLNSSSTNFNITICDGDSIQLTSGNYVHSTGIYIDTLISQNGCDAIITTNLEVFFESTDTLTQYFCPGDTYTLSNGQMINSPGLYSTITSSFNGCDSILVIDLQYSSGVGQSVIDTVNIFQCFGTTYMLPDGTVASQSGQYQSTFSTASVCDSVIITNLNIENQNVVFVDTNLCVGDVYQRPNGNLVTSNSVYSDTLVSALGCDSIIISNVNFYSTDSVLLTAQLCDFTSYILPDGSVAPTQGLYTFNLLNINGCDSVVQVDLTYSNSTTDTVFVSICQDDFYTLPNGWMVNVADDYTFSYTNQSGCDSTVVYSLIVDLVSSEIVNVNSCDNTYLLPNGNLVSQNGIYFDTLFNANGCDSIIITNLMLAPIDTNFINASICSNSSYPLPDGTTTSISGTYVYDLITTSGCDSTIILDLNVTPIVQDTLFASICNGVYQLPNGSLVNTSGIYVDTLIAINGCDSIIVTDLSIGQATNDTILATICENDYYVLPNGWLVNTPNIYDFNFVNASGCDSNITVVLNVNTISQGIMNISECNTSYILPSGLTVVNSGVYFDTLTSTLGCDSIVITNLMFNYSDTTFLTETVCYTNSYNLPNGTTVNSSGNYFVNFSNVNGCDSIVSIDLTILPELVNDVYINLCFGESYTLPDLTVVNSSGVYSHTFNSTFGCDSIINYNITIDTLITTYVLAEICQNDYYQMPNNWLVNLPGIYEVTLTSASGCDSLVTTELVISDSSLNYIPIDDVVICDGLLSPITVDYNAINYVWSNGQLGNTLNPDAPGTYYVNFQSINGSCFGSDTIDVFTSNDCEACVLFVPNSFTPNQSEHNDDFGPTFECEKGFVTYNFTIYNRWGKLVFTTNDPTEKWNGYTDSNMQASTVYVYKINYLAVGEADAKQIVGHVSLLR